MERPDNVTDLNSQEWKSLQGALDRFEDAWYGDTPPDLAHFLPAPGDRLRPLYLREFIHTELEIRWRRQQRALIEDYLRRFGELSENPSCLSALLAEEYRVRHKHGDRPSINVYRIRFPSLFAEMQRLLSGTSPPQSSPPAPSPAAPPPESMLPPGYRLLHPIGAGPFGDVWKAEAPGGVPVALKIIAGPPDSADRQRELQTLNALKSVRHPFLLQVHGYWQLEDRLIIATELADGSLQDELKKFGAAGMPPKQLLGYMEECCEALDFLHGQGILHRDIKPDNILLLNGHVKLADLGLAQLLEERKSYADTICGTPGYMAPEILRREGGRPESDQYGLAATYFELRLNRLLFKAKNFYEMVLMYAQQSPDLAPVYPAERVVLERALAKDPADRFPTCRDFYRALKAAVVPSIEMRESVNRGESSLDNPLPQSSGKARTRGGGDLVLACPAPRRGGGLFGWLKAVFARKASPSDRVAFSVTAPTCLVRGQSYSVDLWVHPPGRHAEVLQRARRENPGIEVFGKAQGEAEVRRGGRIDVHLDVAGLTVRDQEGVLFWQGEAASVGFLVEVPAEARPGSYAGAATFRVAGLKVALLTFTLQVGDRAAPPGPLATTTPNVRRAFASYAREDRDEVLGRVQGMLAVVPDLDVFVDVLSLRAGEHWKPRLLDEIRGRDIFYLFWSRSARASEWVDWEWRRAFEERGVDYIDPVPLEPPDLAPPPQELNTRHFNDPLLGFMSRGRGEART